MSSVSILTVVPRVIAQDLKNKKRITNYNNMPQISKELLTFIKEYMVERVGYDNLPLACLKKSSSEINVRNFIPVNSKEDVLFVLEMPNDSIISVDHSDLLDYSQLISKCTDKEMIEVLGSDFKEKLSLGISKEETSICFIPFLDYDRCKFYSVFTSDFLLSSELNFPEIEKIDLRQLVSFV